MTANSAWRASSRSKPMSERMPTIFSDWPDRASIIAWLGDSRVVLAVDEPWMVSVSARAATPAMSRANPEVQTRDHSERRRQTIRHGNTQSVAGGDADKRREPNGALRRLELESPGN